jgi:polar amino acid transport system substrate-binding protein
MRITRFRGLFAATAVLALVGAACSNGSDSADGGNATTVAPATTVCSTVDATADDALATICASKQLRVATDQKYKPQSWFDVKTNEWKGFDVDVANEVANRLYGAPAEINHQDWDTVTAGSWNNRWDINVGSMTDTIAREKLFEFSPSYYYTPAGIAVNSTNTTITTAADLSGKKVCVGSATTYEDYLTGKLVLGASAPPFEFQVDNPEIVTFITDTDALDQLALGDGVRCDAAITATPTIADYVASGGEIKGVGDPLYFEPLSIALDKNDPVDNASLLTAINQIVEDMHADGTLSDLSQQWYGYDLTVSSAGQGSSSPSA